LAGISVGKILIGIILPDLALTGILAIYVILRCLLQPSLVPAYEITPVPLSKKLANAARYVLPIGFIIFLVSGLIFVGAATPSEAAAAGSMGCFILAAVYGKLNWEVVKKSVLSSLAVSVMVFMIMTGSKAFSQILAFSGATRELVKLVTGLDVDPFLVLVGMQIVLLFLGMLIDAISIIMVTIPLFMPIVHALGFNPVWFAVIFMLNMEIAGVSPPFGMILFTMKSVAPPGTTTKEIYAGAFPIIICELIAMLLIMFVPPLSLWLPNLMR
jgi:tripartite ATP-independent transporter DctM subunit